jgi:AAA domain-containing protein
MRIRSVTAHAFGPLRKETLEFAEGMTVVVGDNESGKSSWHAAMFAAMCGRRRGQGRSREDERFARLHKPWDHDDWLVSARISLDDGRSIELWQDLAGKVDRKANDLGIGQDVSSEVIHEGSPDGSRWLGLDRSTFVATACVEQAQLLRVCDEADGLHVGLPRPPATSAGRCRELGGEHLEQSGLFVHRALHSPGASAGEPTVAATDTDGRPALPATSTPAGSSSQPGSVTASAWGTKRTYAGLSTGTNSRLEPALLGHLYKRLNQLINATDSAAHNRRLTPVSK